MQSLTTGKKGRVWAIAWRERYMYLILLPSVIATGLFCYWPMYGIIMAFKDYDMSTGILGSPWADNFGFGWFKLIFIDPDFLPVIRNTIIISIFKIIIGTSSAIILALLLNEVKHEKYKRTLQSVMYLPHFMSWVIIASLVYNFFTLSGGTFNNIVTQVFHHDKIQILSNTAYFRPLVYLTGVWKEAGFGTIIYLAAIAGVNPELYESAIIDGAGRLKRAWHITLPSIKGTVVILLILNLSSIMSAGFDQIFNLYSPMVLDVGDIIDTYIYRHGILGMEFSYTTAIDLFKQAISIALLVIFNFLAKRAGEEGVF